MGPAARALLVAAPLFTAVGASVGYAAAPSAPVVHPAPAPPETLACAQPSEPAPVSAPTETAPPVVASAPPPPVPDWRAAPTCADLAVRAVVASADAAWSFALVETPAEGAALRRRGEHVGDARVLFVSSERVWLARPSSPTTYAVCKAELGARVPPAAPARVAASPEADPFAHLASKIEARGPREYVVDASVREALVEGAGALGSQVRVAPDIVEGRTVGATLASLRRGSVLERLGLREGDRLRAVNGVDLTSPEQALLAFARLRDAQRVTLVLVRDGRAMQIDYDVR